MFRNLDRKEGGRIEKKKYSNYSSSPRVAGEKNVLLEYVAELWKRQEMCDVIIHTKEDTIQAHKIVLGAHSEFLAKQFVYFPMSHMITINMEEFGTETILELLRFMYTEDVRLTAKNLGPVLSAAEELKIETLKRACQKVFANVTPDNVLDLLCVFAHGKKIGQYDKINDYIVKNFFAISKTESFLHLPFDLLVYFLQKDSLAVPNELEVFNAVVRWLDFDRANRLPVAPQLLNGPVRLQLLSPECLIDKVEGVEWLFSSLVTQAVLTEVYRMKTMILSGKSQQCDCVQRPRLYYQNYK